MILEMHLCGPKGRGQQEELDRAVKLLQLDNELLIQAMLRSGMRVHDTVDDLGLRYQPATASEARSKRVKLRGLRKMVEEGVFACGDAAAYEAAVQSMKYSRRALARVEDFNGQEGLWHSVYDMQGRTIDPVARYLRRTGTQNPWEAMI